jgi:acetyl esterase/lipase
MARHQLPWSVVAKPPLLDFEPRSARSRHWNERSRPEMMFRLPMRRIIPFLVLLLATSAFAAPESVELLDRLTGADSTEYLALEFADVGGQALYLDLFTPDGPGPYPVIVSVHGGSWTIGHRSEGLAFLQVNRGYAVANIDYRLAPGATFPAQIEDVKAAVRWLRANATRFQLDPSRIAVMGYSAGGHLAALLGTSGGVEELEGPGHGNAAFSSRVQAVVDYFGPTDLLKLKAQALPCMPGDPDDPTEAPSLFMGCPIQSCMEKTRSANPITYVTPDDPPFLILHGTADCLVPWQQSKILDDALKAAGVPSRLILVLFATHADPAFLLYQDEVSAFLDQHLKTPRVRRRPVRR